VSSIDAEGFAAAAEENGALLEEWNGIAQRQKAESREAWEEHMSDRY
jgi:hypothetical protein